MSRVLYDDLDRLLPVPPELQDWANRQADEFQRICLSVIEGQCPDCDVPLITRYGPTVDRICPKCNAAWSASWSASHKGWHRALGDDSSSAHVMSP